MSYSNFVKTTISNLEPDLFNELKDVLITEFIPVHLVKNEEITESVCEELLCNYFEKVELKSGKEFGKIVEKYMSDLDSIVGIRIAETPKTRKNQPTPPTPRARKYYEKAVGLRKTNRETKRGLIDYTRLMLCLYTAIINNKYKRITDFELSINCLNLTKIIESMRKEVIPIRRKARFDTHDPYNSDRSSFVILVIMFYYIKSKEVVGEY